MTRPLPNSQIGTISGSSAFRTDHYELTMLDAALASGVAEHEACFEVFARSLPPHRGYGVVGGTVRLAREIQYFRFTQDHLEFLESNLHLHKRTLEFLDNFSFTGSIYGYMEGDLFFPNSPILRVESTFAEALLLETLVLSVLNFDSAIASAASRIFQAANGATLVEMGSRRTHEYAAPDAARMAFICGFSSTSNLEAGLRYGVPTSGTVGHALILSHPSERDAFEAQYISTGPKTTALVDTYDTVNGIEKAIEVFGEDLLSIRIDSGELLPLSKLARQTLDRLGAKNTSIVVSGDLDEYSIYELRDAPIDAFGVGTRLVGGSGYPTANFVYKLVAVGDSNSSISKHGPRSALRPVSKLSPNKETTGGRKDAVRTYDEEGIIVKEFTIDPDLALRHPEAGKLVQHLLVEKGASLIDNLNIIDLREFHTEAMSTMPASVRQNLYADAPYITVEPWQR